MLGLSTMEMLGLTRRRILTFLGIALAAAACDGFGMTMFLPVLEYIDKGQSPEVLAAGSRTWSALAAVFGAVGLPLTFAALLGVVLGLILLRVGLNYLRQCYTVWLTQTALHHTRMSLFTSLVGADYGLFDSQSTGRIVNLASNEAVRVGGYFGAAFTLAIQAVLISGFLGVLLWLNPAMTLFAVAILGLGGGLVYVFIRQTRRLGRQVTTSNTTLTFLLVERLTGIRLLKLSAAGEREAARLDRSSEEVRESYYQLQKINARVELLLEPVVATAGLCILFVSVSVFHMTLAEVGLFMLILLRLLPLCKELLRSRQSLMGNSAAVEAVLGAVEEAKRRAEPQNGPGRAFTGLGEGVRFAGVGFTYPGQKQPALSGVDLFIPAGQITALVGPSGAGKSTLVDLLPRLRLPDAGRILFDGTPGEDFDLASLRRGMAFVSQDAFILNDTVRANLSFARPEAGEAELWEALERARAREFVESLPKGLDSDLGERGVTLSGGQRQRLSLARALVQASPLLVLDEPTSALDSEVEKDIQQAIEEMRARGQFTIVIIAHRLSTIRNADRIIVLMGGRVVEQGTHRELMVSEEWYAKVSGMQSATTEN